MANRVDLEMLSRDRDFVAILVSTEDVFSFLNREIIVPPSCAALAWIASGLTRMVLPGRAVESADTRELLFVRTVPFALNYSVGGLTSKDGYEFAASLTLSVQVVPEKAELLSFRDALLGSGSYVKADDLRGYCEAVARSALGDFARARDAATLASPIARGEFDAVLDAHFRPLGFESGLALGGDTKVGFESAAYAGFRQNEQTAASRRRQQEVEEQLRTAAARARVKHLDELGKLLEQAKSMASKSGKSIVDLIKTFDPARRGALYEGLAALNPPTRRTEAIIVVAGNEVLAFEATDLRQPESRLQLSSEVGPLRSVRLGRDGDRRLLLVGARNGVHVVEWRSESRQVYAFKGDLRPRNGFNAAVRLGEHLYATHSEIGLVRWPWQTPSDARSADDIPPAPGTQEPRPFCETCIADVTRGASVVRSVQVDDSGRLWLSLDERVIGWLPEAEAAPVVLPAPAVVETLLVRDGFVHGGLSDGAVLRWNAADPASNAEAIRGPSGSAVGSLAWLAGGGVPRLLIADGRPQLDLHVLGDAYRGEYRCDQKLRWGFAADDFIIGVNDRRDQIFVWRVEDPERPMASANVGRLCGHSVQDVAMLPGDEAWCAA
ncbi:MAG TPA: hypothetical protein VMV94_20215 [Phycisphaerae bacterium]|nr:hypothetical protein [Phycisphaerae bacterium]